LESFMFTWFIALLTTLCALSWSPVVFACKCAEPEPPKAALAKAQAVFQGEVASIDDSGDALVVTLRVPRAWKGIDSAEVAKVRTRKESAACGYPFALGENYLVYAAALEPAESGVSLQVAHCSRTRLFAEAEEDVHELGMGAIPVKLQAPEEATADDQKPNAVERKRDQPAAGGCASCSVGQRSRAGDARYALLIAGSVAGVLMLRARRRAPR
jgi:hypothetical protein